MSLHSKDSDAAPPSDLAVVKRAGRVAAFQASAALALVLLLVGGVVFAVYVRTQRRQIDAELQSVAMAADDTRRPAAGHGVGHARTEWRDRGERRRASPVFRC